MKPASRAASTDSAKLPVQPSKKNSGSRLSPTAIENLSWSQTLFRPYQEPVLSDPVLRIPCSCPVTICAGYCCYVQVHEADAADHEKSWCRKWTKSLYFSLLPGNSRRYDVRSGCRMSRNDWGRIRRLRLGVVYPLHLRGETIERLRQRPSNIAALGMGGTPAISKTSFCRAARFGNSLPVLSHMAALEGCLSGQGTRGDGLNRCPGWRRSTYCIRPSL
jgi:hypothetical protein